MSSPNAWEIEWKLLYSVIVAGKSAEFAQNVMDRFFGYRNDDEGPLDLLRRLVESGEIDEKLREARAGSYTRIGKCFTEIIEYNLDPATCSVAKLEEFHGIGPKTARFFVMWTRENQNYAALDTHILKWMNYLGWPVPKSTPSGKKYAEIERHFLAEAQKRNISARDLDALIWEYCHAGGHKSGNWPGILTKI